MGGRFVQLNPLKIHPLKRRRQKSRLELNGGEGRLPGAALRLLLCKDNQELNSRLFGAFKCLRLNLEVEPCEISRKLVFPMKTIVP